MDKNGGYMTVSGLNSQSYGDGNILYTGNINNLINSNFTLPVGSEALNAGVSIEALISGTFVDRFGNTVNKAQPNVGSCDNNP